MGSAEVEAMDLEVDFHAYEHQGWNGATHQVSAPVLECR